MPAEAMIENPSVLDRLLATSRKPMPASRIMTVTIRRIALILV